MATSLKIDETLEHRIRQLARQRGRSAQSIMREAVQQYVEREEARESLLQEALAAWAEFGETGRHLSGDELREWLASWDDEGPRPAPPCHG
jgi:predicted transcriptional regulator